MQNTNLVHFHKNLNKNVNKVIKYLQDSEKVSNNFIIKMTELDISLHAANKNVVLNEVIW